MDQPPRIRAITTTTESISDKPMPGAHRREGDLDTAKARRFVELRRLDALGSPIIEAAGYLGSAGYRTYGGPQRFAGDDGRRYRVKSRAQEGHGAEMIGNRVGAYFGISPQTTVLSIGAGAVPRDHSLDHLVGLQVASEELDDVMNDEELRAFGATLRPDQVDWPSWALVVCFQTWLHVRDEQAVLRLTDGKCFSVDHGKCFDELLKGPPSAVVVPALHGVAGVLFESSAVAAAIEAIERVPEASILAMVAGVPDEIGWRMPIERKYGIAEWLIKRQPGMREVMRSWMPRLT